MIEAMLVIGTILAIAGAAALMVGIVVLAAPTQEEKGKKDE